ncbi:MAG: hypothetical protein H7333_10860 [Bdellovibrionales bacterium]|nr:hypothetical protein [Oligoflexia bacterium]
MTAMIPEQPANSYRVHLTLPYSQRLDGVLMQALRGQDDNLDLKNLSRGAFKELFKNKRILIKGQNAKPASDIAKGETYVDILGFTAKSN